MRLYNLAIIFAAAVMAVGCAGSEDDLEPSSPYVNPFDIPADKTDEESVLRRDFYNRNGIYLVLGEVVGEGVDPDGNSYTETIDIGWGLNSNPQVDNITYLSTIEDKRKSVTALEDYILPHIAGGDKKPYSVLPVASYADSYGKELYILSNMRCTLINVGSVLEADNEEDTELAVNTVLKNIVTQLLSDLDYATKKTFYDISRDYHDSYISTSIPDWAETQDITLVYEYGFLKYSADYKGDANYDRFPYYTTDFNQFRDLVMNYTEEEVVGMYGEYPSIMYKYDKMKEIIAKAGYSF